MSAGGGPRFAIRVDDQIFDEDLARCTSAGKSAIEMMLSLLSKEGVPREWLRRCEAEGRDGTHLGGCVKLYIPQPAGRWGAVFAADLEHGVPVLLLLAVGERHPDQPWRPSVYEIAHRRLRR